MVGPWVFAPHLVRLRTRWEARAKRRVCLTLHHLGLFKPLSFVQWDLLGEKARGG
jgi:hypothetical protein